MDSSLSELESKNSSLKNSTQVYKPYRKPEFFVESSSEDRPARTSAPSPLVDARGSVTFDRISPVQSPVGEMTPLIENEDHNIAGKDDGLAADKVTAEGKGEQ